MSDQAGATYFAMFYPHPSSPDVSQLRSVVATDSYLVQDRLTKDDSFQGCPSLPPPTKSITSLEKAYCDVNPGLIVSARTNWERGAYLGIPGLHNEIK